MNNFGKRRSVMVVVLAALAVTVGWLSAGQSGQSRSTLLADTGSSVGVGVLVAVVVLVVAGGTLLIVGMRRRKL